MSRSLPSRREFLQQGPAALAIGGMLRAGSGEVLAGPPTNQRSVSAPRQAIAGWRREAGEAARDVLLNGGNAIDAASAALLVLCVVDPSNVGIGGYGGSFIIYHARSRRVRAIDSNTRAPRKFDLNTFNERTASRGYLALGVPGIVAGIDLALREYGSLPFKAVAKYALALAESGITVTRRLAEDFGGLLKEIDSTSRRAYFPNGVPAEGTTWIQADLARLIRRLGDEGPASFYSGEIAATIAQQVKAEGGVLTEDDLRRFHASVVEPLHITYRGFDLYTPPLPSGGLTTLSILKTLEQIDLSRMELWSAEFVELFTAVSNLVWRERFEYFGDPDFVNVPVDQLLSEKRAIARAELVRRGVPTTASPASEPSHTVNVVVVDKDQNLVSWTATHGGDFGSHVAIEGLGLMLGHGMSRFAFKSPDPNYPVGGKRPQHNMSPLVVLRDGKPYAALGMPGGRRMITVTAQMVMKLIDFKLAPQRIVSGPRVHTEGDQPIQVADMPPVVVEELRKRGHKVDIQPFLGGAANTIVIDPTTDRVEAAASGNPPGVLVF